MRHRLLAVADKLLPRKRAVITPIADEFKNVCQIEHPRNFLVNLMAGLIAYCYLPKKPLLDLGQPALTAA